jgi:hypothetical protein
MKDPSIPETGAAGQMLHAVTSPAALRELAKTTRAALADVEAGVDLLAAATGALNEVHGDKPYRHVDGVNDELGIGPGTALTALKRWVSGVEDGIPRQ